MIKLNLCTIKKTVNNNQLLEILFHEIYLIGFPR